MTVLFKRYMEMDIGKIVADLFSGNNLTLIIANIVIFTGCTLMVITGYIKEEKKMLRVQDAQLFFLAVGNLLLKGYSGFIISLLALVKNEIYLAKKLNYVAKALIMSVAVVMTFIFNNRGLVGLYMTIAVETMSEQHLIYLQLSVVW